MTRISIGSVWRTTAEIVQRHFSTFATLAAAFIFLPAVLVSALFPHLGVIRVPVSGQPAPPFPGGLVLLLLAVTTLIAFIGQFSIGAIAVDPAEGGGRSIGEIIAGVLPKIGKGLLAGLLLLLAYVAIAMTAVVIIGILGAMFGGAGVSRTSTTPGQVPPMAMTIGWLSAAIVVPVTIWVMARLLPMLGVLLREPLSALGSIKRAWALSRDSTGPIVGLVLLAAVASILPTIVLEGLRRGLGAETGVTGLLFTILRSAVSALIAVYYYTAIAVVYRHLTERR